MDRNPRDVVPSLYRYPVSAGEVNIDACVMRDAVVSPAVRVAVAALSLSRQ